MLPASLHPAAASNRTTTTAGTLDLREDATERAGEGRTTTVLLASAREVLALGFSRIVAAATDLELVGVVSSTEELCHAIADRAAGVVVVDVQLDGQGGVEVNRRLAATAPDGMRHWFLLDHVDARTVARLSRGGAAGFLHTSASAEQLRDTLRHRTGAGVVMDPVTAQVVARDVLVVPAGAERDLSDRDLELLDLLADGLTNREMAAALYLSEKTVKNCLSGLFRRLGVRSRTEAALLATGTVGVAGAATAA